MSPSVSPSLLPILLSDRAQVPFVSSAGRVIRMQGGFHSCLGVVIFLFFANVFSIQDISVVHSSYADKARISKHLAAQLA